MELMTESAVQRYLENDTIGVLMDEVSSSNDEALVCQKWLRDSAPKRLIFERLYGDLLHGPAGRRVLDVGGGLTCFTWMLAGRHQYELIDLMAHADTPAMERMAAERERPFIHVIDWYEFTPDDGYDVVIANDLFPNVDQRLDLFLEKTLPIAQEIRVSLTYYPQTRFYMTKRIEGEEFFCMLAWDEKATVRVLEKYSARLKSADLNLLTMNNVSVYPNGRQVCLVRLEGDRV